MNQQKGLARGARPAISDLTEPELLHARPRAVRLRAAAPVGDAVGAADRVGSEAFDGAHVRLWIQRAEVALRPIGRQFEEAGVGSGGGEEKDGEESGDDEDRRRSGGEWPHFGELERDDLEIASRRFRDRSIFRFTVLELGLKEGRGYGDSRVFCEIGGNFFLF